MMQNTDKSVCRTLAALLVEHGVRRVFVSPGSRNAPIIIAINRCADLEATVVIDERAAAFMAMGYAIVSDQPVAIVCTSGTALLNYAPAVAEAYYRKVPLIVVSADRPMEWIDQDDSQTLRQPGALANYVKLSCDIPEITTPNLMWYANRKINDAILSALTGRRAPVHINVQLEQPLGRTGDYKPLDERVVRAVTAAEMLPEHILSQLAARLGHGKRVMVIAGFTSVDNRLNEALHQLARRQNVVVLTETISNLHSPHFISAIDTTLTMLDAEQKAALAPDVVITVGGALVSRFIKGYLRRVKPSEHWHIGISHTTIDCFQSLTLRVEIDPGLFLEQIATHLCQSETSDTHGGYASQWRDAYLAGMRHCRQYAQQAEWSDMKAFAAILADIPRSWNLQLSNGTPVRYAQLFGDMGMHRSDCNRGVSGIDGCTSTAIGAAMAYSGTTLLISGDTSAQYDVGAFANVRGLNRFKMIVMCNGGGGIFRFIPSTSSLAELERYFAFDPVLPLPQLADGYGMAYFEASDQAELKRQLPLFINEAERPAILAIHTPPKESAEILKNYFIH